jgi:hypothetical protein
MAGDGSSCPWPNWDDEQRGNTHILIRLEMGRALRHAHAGGVLCTTDSAFFLVSAHRWFHHSELLLCSPVAHRWAPPSPLARWLRPLRPCLPLEVVPPPPHSTTSLEPSIGLTAPPLTSSIAVDDEIDSQRSSPPPPRATRTAPVFFTAATASSRDSESTSVRVRIPRPLLFTQRGRELALPRAVVVKTFR